MQELISQPRLIKWVERSLAARENILAVSNQGTVLLYKDDGLELVVKTAMGRGLLRIARQKTLLREYQAYQRLDGLSGVPACHALLAGRYLVLDFVRATPYRDAVWADRAAWFDEFLALLRAIHERGVSHGDLKSKSNILVTGDEKPCLIDFGTAFLRKPGFHPLNNRLFEYGKRLDINAWVKHKYRGRYEDISEQDRQLLDYSRLEYLVRKFSGRPTRVLPYKKK
ncbi:MAG: phosphotransferase [Xanthomonadales bacterium]|nr:phosphotransferase [Xanthomonadales bacterium]